MIVCADQHGEGKSNTFDLVSGSTSHIAFEVIFAGGGELIADRVLCL